MTVLRPVRTLLAAGSGALCWLYAAIAAASPTPSHGQAAADGTAALHGEPGHSAHQAVDHAHAGISWLNWPSPEDHRVGLVYLLINFAVLAFLLHRLLIRKLVADTAARHDTIRGQVDQARQAMADAESVIADYQGRIDRLDQETRQILDQARAGAEADRQRLLAAATAEVERFKAQALASAQREVQLRRQQIEDEVLDRAVSRAEEILRNRFTEADQARLVDDYAVEIAGAVPRA